MKSSLLSKTFWAKTAERAVKTAAQFMLGLFAGTATGVVTIAWADSWQALLTAGATGAVFSTLTSIATANVGPSEDPSAV